MYCSAKIVPRVSKAVKKFGRVRYAIVCFGRFLTVKINKYKIKSPKKAWKCFLSLYRFEKPDLYMERVRIHDRRVEFSVGQGEMVAVLLNRNRQAKSAINSNIPLN